MKKRKRVKLEFAGKTNPELAADAKAVKAKLDGDTTFDVLDPEVVALGNAILVLENADAAYATATQTVEQRLAEMNVARAILEAKISVLGSGVEHIAAGDTTIVLRSGFQPVSAPIPIGPLGPPQNVEASMSDHEGQIAVKWRRLNGARSYVVEYCLEGTTVWRQAGLSTKSSFTITGLESGKKYRVRVCGVGAAGTGPYSDEAVKMAA